MTGRFLPAYCTDHIPVKLVEDVTKQGQGPRTQKVVTLVLLVVGILVSSMSR